MEEQRKYKQKIKIIIKVHGESKKRPKPEKTEPELQSKIPKGCSKYPGFFLLHLKISIFTDIIGRKLPQTLTQTLSPTNEIIFYSPFSFQVNLVSKENRNQSIIFWLKHPDFQSV